MVSKPDIGYPLKGKIETTLFLSVSAGEKYLAMAEVLSRHSILVALLNNYLPAVEFRSIFDLNELARRLIPFRSGKAVSIERRCERLSIAISTPGQDRGKFSISPGDFCNRSQGVAFSNMLSPLVF